MNYSLKIKDEYEVFFKNQKGRLVVIGVNEMKDGHVDRELEEKELKFNAFY